MDDSDSEEIFSESSSDEDDKKKDPDFDINTVVGKKENVSRKAVFTRTELCAMTESEENRNTNMNECIPRATRTRYCKILPYPSNNEIGNKNERTQSMGFLRREDVAHRNDAAASTTVNKLSSSTASQIPAVTLETKDDGSHLCHFGSYSMPNSVVMPQVSLNCAMTNTSSVPKNVIPQNFIVNVISVMGEIKSDGEAGKYKENKFNPVTVVDGRPTGNMFIPGTIGDRGSTIPWNDGNVSSTGNLYTSVSNRTENNVIPSRDAETMETGSNIFSNKTAGMYNHVTGGNHVTDSIKTENCNTSVVKSETTCGGNDKTVENTRVIANTLINVVAIETEIKSDLDIDKLTSDKSNINSRQNDLVGVNQPNIRPSQNDLVGVNQPNIRPLQNDLVGVNHPNIRPSQNELVGVNHPNIRPLQNDLVGVNQPNIRPTQNESVGVNQPKIRPSQNESVGINQLLGVNQPNIRPRQNNCADINKSTNGLIDQQTFLSMHNNLSINQLKKIRRDKLLARNLHANNDALHVPIQIYNYNCTDCKMEFFSESDEDEHMVKHAHQNPFKCRSCGDKFPYRKDLETHIKEVCLPKNSKAGRSVCTKCGEQFSCKRKLETHFPIHSSDIGFKCKICGRIFVMLHYYDLHFRSHSVDSKPLKCDQCGKEYRSKNGLDQHTQSVHGDGPLGVCDICGKSFKNESLFKSHYRRHNKVKPHNCDVCNKGFNKRSDLETHLRLHTGDKPYMCHICGKRYRLKNGLNTHKVIHTGKKAFKCDVCGRGFALKPDLKRHEIIHTGAKPFKCPLCSQAFSQHASIIRHVKSVHKKSSLGMAPGKGAQRTSMASGKGTANK